MEKRLKAVVRGTSGSKSLLAKASTIGSSGAGGASRGGARGSSMFGGGNMMPTGSMFRGGGYAGGATVYSQKAKSKLRNPRSS